jgi:hypothetical protein
MSSRIFRLAIITGMSIAVCIAGASLSPAQEYHASIIGQVSDSSGAPIPGATVIAVQHGTNQTYATKANSHGDYAVDYINSGQFTVTIGARGFAQRVYPNVTLAAGQQLNLNVTLSVGSVRQRVTVTSEPGLLNTANASSGGTLNETMVQNMPSANGRGVFIDAIFAQGVKATSYGDIVTYLFAPTGVGGQISVNGSPNGSNTYYVDGAPVSPAGTVQFIPTQDSVAEFQSSVSGGAQYGPGEGAVFSAVIKQGTNKFHGSVYDYLSNTVVDANTFYGNLEGIPVGTNALNNFGGTLGGPIRKNKAYFFFAYGGERDYQPGTPDDSVPTAAMRNGDFTGTGYTIYDPAKVTCVETTSAGCSKYSRSPFPNDTIPQSDISPIGAKIIGLYPLPTLSGVSSNYPTIGSRHTNYDQWLSRLDQTISERTNLSEMFALQDTYFPQTNNAFPGPASTDLVATDRNIIATADLTHTFSPSLVGDVRASFGRYSAYTITGKSLQDKYSLPGLTMPFIPTTPEQNIAPEVAVSNFTSILGNTESGTVNNYWYLSPSATQSKGRHILQYGFEFMGLQSGATGIPGEANGTFSFTGQWTQQNPLTATTGAGNGMADLLLGYPASGSVVWGTNDFISSHYYAAYLQDDFKVRQNLTLNLGLRWDANTSPTERHNGINGSFCFTCTNPYNADVNHTAYPTLENPLTGGLTFAGATAPRAPYNVDLSDWQPRLGIAWSINPKTVFRAGFGIYYSVANFGNTATGFTQTTSYVDSLNGNVSPTNYFFSGNPFPNGAVAPTGASGGLKTAAGTSIAYNSPTGAIPWTQHWSVGFQRALPKRTLLDVEYVGSHTHNIDVSQPWGVISSAQQAACFANNAVCNTSAPNPFYGVLPSNVALGASKTLPTWELDRSYPLFNGVTQSNNPVGYSNYNSLEARVERRIRTLDLVANYTWENNMAANGYLNSSNFVDSNLFYGPWGDEQRQYWDAEVFWPLPVGQGGIFFQGAHGVLGALLNHWEGFSAVVYFTGYPLSPSSANLVGGPGCTSYYPVGGQTRAHWFNNDVSCYQPLNQWQARTTPLYVGYLRDPRFVDWNGGIQKNFVLPREGMSLRVRIECTNCSNTASWAGPNTTVSALPTFTSRVGWSGFGTVTSQQGSPRYMYGSLELTF